MPEEPTSGGGIGMAACGEDLFTQGALNDIVPCITFNIGPIPDDQIGDFVGSGKKRQIINNFYNYFIPVEYEMELQFESMNPTGSFTLDNAFLGYNT